MSFEDTIFALSSGGLPAGVAVVRISGPAVRAALRAIAGDVPQPRLATLRRLRHRNGDTLDRGLVLFFPAPESFTGEDCGELHIHGGSAVVAVVLAELGSFAGLRVAEAGEFTRRAFANGKLDLTEAEALSDLLQAQTEGQRRFAVANGSGRNAALYGEWRQRLLRARSHLEAILDFSEEEDVGLVAPSKVLADVSILAADIGHHAASYRQAEIIRSGFQVVILGAPNAGKSSLLNALAARDVAIVTEEPGTTRDLVRIELDIEGSKVVVTDTAGIRGDAGRVEQIGIERALSAAAEADLVIQLEDIGDPHAVDMPSGCEVLRVGSKVDLQIDGPEGGFAGAYHLCVSAVTGRGIADLLRELGAAAGQRVTVPGAVPFRERHVAILNRCLAAITTSLKEGAGVELQAEELRVAADELARITGAIETEEMLGVIFSNFCIGK